MGHIYLTRAHSRLSLLNSILYIGLSYIQDSRHSRFSLCNSVMCTVDLLSLTAIPLCRLSTIYSGILHRHVVIIYTASFT
jgi:hypothetical protein